MLTPTPCRRFRRALKGVAVLLLATVVWLTGCKKKADDVPDVSVSVQAQQPSIGPISEQIRADAVLAPMAQAALSPRMSSPIRAEYVQRGEHVHRGQLLMTLEDRDLQGSALESRGALTSAEASYTAMTSATIPDDVQKAELDVTQAKANLEVAERTSADRARLFQQGALPGRDADIAAAAAVQAHTTYDIAARRLTSILKTTRVADAKAAEGQVTSARGRVLSAEAQVRYASLRSPIDGVVTDRPFFPGETAAAGSPVLTIMDTSSLLAKLHIAQASAQQVRLGGTAEITVPGVQDPVRGTITLISPALDPGSTTVEVWVKLANAGGLLKVGSSVHVVLPGTTVANAMEIPVAALLPAQDGSARVMIVGPDGKAHMRPVKVGIRTPELIQITDGLGAGDLVIVEGSYGLDDGTKVTLGHAKSSAEDKD